MTQTKINFNKILPIIFGGLLIALLVGSVAQNPGVNIENKPPAKPKDYVMPDITGSGEKFKLMDIDPEYTAPAVRNGNTIIVEAKEQSSEEPKKEEQSEAVQSTDQSPNTISVTRFNKSFTVREEIIKPVLQARTEGKINTHTAAMILSLHVIESPYSGWAAMGCNVNNLQSGCAAGEGGRGYGRFGVGLLQVMSYPEWGIANKAIGKEYSIQDSLQDPVKQIEVIKGLMMNKTGATNGTGFIAEEYNESQMNGLARSWLGEGCDKHGTCTGVYAEEAVKNYKTIFNNIKSI